MFVKIRDFIFPKGSKREKIVKFFYHKFLFIFFKIKDKFSYVIIQNKHKKAISNFQTIIKNNFADPSSIEFVNNYLELKQIITENNAQKMRNFFPKEKHILNFQLTEINKIIENLEFNENRTPHVSIIIPTYNNLKYLVECLYSISKSSNKQQFEVIIVFDGIDNEYWNKLESIKNIILIRNIKNSGFSVSCNNGAKQAKGKYLLFLNDDTQVQENWLDSLVDVAENQPQTGVIGPKVIYPNGYLQEAGCSIKNNGEIIMNGYGQDPNLPKFNFIREVDYCSGVCILIKKEIFFEINGFDEEYSPAYYEDTDLSMKLYCKGYKSYYCPQSEIIHHLNATTNLTLNDQKYQLASKNRQKFLEKWIETLQQRNIIKYIAFYLPQFHPCVENDLWWGKGFTEWFNVARAKPNYPDHYQPHIPSDLGFYDLRLLEVMEDQAKLAKKYGINGFCYYYYWFSNKRLLDMPLERMLEIDRPDFPFCLCWANENWSRRWDGSESHILIAQDYSEQSDLEVIKDLVRYFNHKNYIKIDGKPIILIYRITLFPDFIRTSKIWRKYCQENGIGEILIGFVESFDLTNQNILPSDVGADFSVEFPPHELGFRYENSELNLVKDFTGSIFDYDKAALKNINKDFSNFYRFKTAMPRWDNTPRMQKRAHIFANSSPGSYQAWLEKITRMTFEHYSGDYRMVFLNAWNEWAEGNYLEPDDKYGHEFLHSTKNAKDFIVNND